MKTNPTDNLALREWQREAFASYLEELQRGERTALWEATPGAGKTTAALMLVRHQLKNRLAEKVLIVVPTSHLRVQWARAAAAMGVALDSTFGSAESLLAADYHGAVVTYQQFGNRGPALRHLAERSVVVLDEVHHAGDGLSWGDALLLNLEKARYVLCLSGTAFRSDSNPIPFVKYDKDGISTPNYVYPYARAVEEGVCRPTAFFTYGGEVSWVENEVEVSAAFSDSLDYIGSARRLRAALDPEAGWVAPMLKDAQGMLLNLRKEHSKAGALMVCADREHAKQMARLIQAVTGEKPTVVLSDDSHASKKIKQFADDSSQWLVACNMVSEGVDIPRLRIGVYTTTIRTKLYFRQFLGRIVRRQAEIKGSQVAYLYLPADPILHQLAQEIESETRHSLNKKQLFLFGDELDDRQNDQGREKRVWCAVSGINSGVEAVLLHGNQLSLFGETLATDQVREAIDKEVVLRQEQVLTKSEVKQGLAAQIKNLVGMLHRKTGKSHSTLHTILNRSQSVQSQTHCTELQLRERVQLIERMLIGPEAGPRPQRGRLVPSG